jgi:copper chaperone CopZ
VNCATAARVVLQRVSGVQQADVSYEAGKAVVTYDPELTAPEEFIAELERMTGFTAQVEAVAGDAHEAGEMTQTGAAAHDR